MSSKRKINHEYKHLKKIREIYLLVPAVFFLIVGIYGMRQNYSEMVSLRSAVYTADEQNGDVNTALNNLREFVYGHMNTNLSSGDVSIKPPIQLKYRYERLAKAEQQKADTTNASIKKTGEQICLAQYPGYIFNSNRVNCVAKYISDHSVKPKTISSDLYKFDFVSPAWSPDLAGISLLISLIFFSAVIVRAAVGLWYRFRLD